MVGIIERGKEDTPEEVESLTKSKRIGNLVFKELNAFNTDCFTKMVDRLILEPNASWVRNFKGLYYPNNDFLRALMGGHASWVWSSLIK